MTVEGITIRDNTVLILDEVDGMSGGDRGGVGAINQLIKKTRIPIILICNDRKSAKMKPFDHTTFGLPFQRPKADSIRSRLQTIAFREKLKVDKNGMDMLISAAQNDIRLVINMLSTWKLGQSALSYDDSKKLGAENVKPGMPTPWSLYSELSSHALWAASSKKTLNQKTEIYFSDMGMVPLFVQENYIRQRPQSTMAETDSKKKDLKTLQLLNGAAAAISDGDVVDNMIHGSQQQWSLLPLHAVQSTLKPMSLMYGMGPEGSYGPAFPAWFGQNSKQGRLFRATVELQTKMRLTASGSRHEVREQYLPHLFTGLSKPLLSSGASGIPDVVELLDAYYLNLEDRENIMELGVGKNNGDEVLKKVPTAVKSAFTRQYNAASHPIALQRGDLGSGGRAKQLVGDAAPDAEEAIIQDEVVDESGSEMGDSDDDLDFTKDKMIKEKKQKAAKGKAKAK
jgi:replication factor C subunit 1